MNGTVAGCGVVCGLAEHPGTTGKKIVPPGRIDRQQAAALANRGDTRKRVPDPFQESTGRTIMKTRTLTLCALVTLLLAAMAALPRPAEARDNIFVGADLGGLFVHFDNYPRRAWGPPPPHHYRSWGPPPPPRHYRAWGPPPPPRYWHPRPYYHHAPPPPPRYSPYGRHYRHW